jgi:hypothetical protein
VNCTVLGDFPALTLMEESEILHIPVASQTSDDNALPEVSKKPTSSFFSNYKRSMIFAAIILLLTFTAVVEALRSSNLVDHPTPKRVSHILNDGDIYGESSFKISNGRYAVCISGNEGELLLRHRFWQNLADNVLTDQADLFIYHETADPIVHGLNETYRRNSQSEWSDAPDIDHQFDINRLKEMYGPWLRSFVITTRNLDNEVEFYNRLGNKTAGSQEGYNNSLRRFIKLAKCHALLQSYEYFKNDEYEVVVHMRPDVLFPRPIDYRKFDEPDVLYTMQGFPRPNARHDGLFKWFENRIGIIDFAFFGSSLITRTFAQFVSMELASLDNYPLDNSFPEGIIKWLVVDRLRMKTKMTDPENPLWGQQPTGGNQNPIENPTTWWGGR